MKKILVLLALLCVAPMAFSQDSIATRVRPNDESLFKDKENLPSELFGFKLGQSVDEAKARLDALGLSYTQSRTRIESETVAPSTIDTTFENIDVRNITLDYWDDKITNIALFGASTNENSEDLCRYARNQYRTLYTTIEDVSKTIEKLSIICFPNAFFVYHGEGLIIIKITDQFK